MTGAAADAAADERYMRAALALGARGLGRVWPNPAVGCVLVNGGRVVGRGWTQPGGRPHAEAEALGRAGREAARGATAYVTLEPCANWGRTAPCAGALVEAGVARAVVGCLDPDPRVDGRGLAWLRGAGVGVALGCLAAEAREAHLGLYRRIRDGRPMVTLKLAASLDGRIAAAGGRSRWITGEAARAHAHHLRATHDAVLVGIGTALADDPALDCRLPGLGHASPVRVVLDRGLRLPPGGRLARTAREVPLWIVAGEAAPADAAARLEAAGARIVRVAPGAAGAAGALAALAREGITRLLAEGGAGVATALLAGDLVDRLHLLTAPLALGGDGLAWLGPLGLAGPGEAAGRWRPALDRRLGPDHLRVLHRVERQPAAAGDG